MSCTTLPPVCLPSYQTKSQPTHFRIRSKARPKAPFAACLPSPKHMKGASSAFFLLLYAGLRNQGVNEDSERKSFNLLICASSLRICALSLFSFSSLNSEDILFSFLCFEAQIQTSSLTTKVPILSFNSSFALSSTMEQLICCR